MGGKQKKRNRATTLYWGDVRAVAKALKVKIKEARTLMKGVRYDEKGKRVARADQIENLRERIAIQEEVLAGATEEIQKKPWVALGGELEFAQIQGEVIYFDCKPWFVRPPKVYESKGEVISTLREMRDAGDEHFKYLDTRAGKKDYHIWRVGDYGGEEGLLRHILGPGVSGIVWP